MRDDPIGDYNERRQQSMEEDRNRKFIYAPDAKALIVDDNYMNIQVAVNLLKRNGVKPDTAAGGRACLEQAEKNHYDIIFMDHMMPGMDGIETFRQLRARKLLPPETAPEDWENYHIQVHALKSTSKSIGATDLSEQARELEMAAKAGDAAYLKEHHAGCMEAYRNILGKVETLLGMLN